MIELIAMLKDITGFDGISLQPNAGAQVNSLDYWL